MKTINVKYYYCLRCEKFHYSYQLNRHNQDKNNAFLSHIEFDKDKYKNNKDNNILSKKTN